MAAQPAVAVAVPVVAVAQQPPSYAAAAPAGGGGGGARPSAWIYPVKGLSHFVQHPALWPYALCPLIIGVIATIIALILIFGAAFVPQQEWLEGWWGSAFLAWIAAFLLCLVEVAIAANRAREGTGRLHCSNALQTCILRTVRDAGGDHA